MHTHRHEATECVRCFYSYRRVWRVSYKDDVDPLFTGGWRLVAYVLSDTTA